MGTVLLISDLHLSAERPAANEAFFSFLEERVPGAQSLYILGDLFEYWIGDDDLETPFHAVVAGLLQRTVQQGTPVMLMHGNRDFLMAGRFCEASGAQLLQDPAVVDLFGTPTLLMHGDTLCTGDAAYLEWRDTCRSTTWKEQFLSQALETRRAAMLDLRAQSEAGKREKPAQIMDVDASAVAEALRRHGCRRLIHGHTHRPARHTLQVDGQDCERWVLPDWYVRGGCLEVSAAGVRSIALPFD
jgi:UDP-2,3-diacylglucosamine hydrolase